MLANVTHVLPLTTIRRERVLPRPGKVLVRKGQKVIATDTVAETGGPPQHLLLDVARGLAVPVSKADKLLQVQEDAQLSEGDLIAGPVGFGRRVVRSPVAGRVILAGSGQILLAVDTPPLELKAGLPGTVIDLVPDRGVIIETTGSLIQCVWGNGGVNYGLMSVQINAFDQELTSDRIDVSLRGSVILAGYCSSPEVLKTIAELPCRGLILSSMDISLIPVASELKMPVVLLEGFGQRPMNSAAFKLLTTNDRREVVLNGEAWDAFAGKRPEIYIPLPATGEPPLPRDSVEFAPGKQVRVVRAPFAGQVGSVVEIRPGFSVLPSGLRAPAAEVRMEDGQVTVLPLVNLEILE